MRRFRRHRLARSLSTTRRPLKSGYRQLRNTGGRCRTTHRDRSQDVAFSTSRRPESAIHWLAAPGIPLRAHFRRSPASGQSAPRARDRSGETERRATLPGMLKRRDQNRPAESLTSRRRGHRQRKAQCTNLPGSPPAVVPTEVPICLSSHSSRVSFTGASIT